MTSIPSTTYLILVGNADVPRMSAMNAIFDQDSIKWTLPEEIFHKTKTFLDVGCGNGELTIKLALKRMQKDPNYSVRFIDFIQVKAIKS